MTTPDTTASPPAAASAPSAEIALPIVGMTCASCVNRIDRFLRKADGVAEVSVYVGAAARGAGVGRVLLEELVARRGVFIYERDMKKLSTSLTAFDSFLCAYTALLSHRGGCEKPPRGFPKSSGWVEFPKEE